MLEPHHIDMSVRAGHGDGDGDGAEDRTGLKSLIETA